MKSISPSAKPLAACIIAIAAAGANTLASAQKMPDLTSLAGFTIGQPCMADSGRKWVTDQAKGPVETRNVDEGRGFHRADYFDGSSAERMMTVNVHCTPEGRAWRINLSMVFKTDGERRALAIDRAYARFGKPILYTDLWADPAFRKQLSKAGKTGSALMAYWSTEPAPWKGSLNSARPSQECAGSDEDLRSICEVTRSMKEEDARRSQMRGVVTKVQFVFDLKDGREVVSAQTIEMTDVAVRARKDQASAAQQRSLQDERDKRAAQITPTY